MAQLRQDYQKFVDLDTEVVIVGPESPKEFKHTLLKKTYLYRSGRPNSFCAETLWPKGKPI